MQRTAGMNKWKVAVGCSILIFSGCAARQSSPHAYSVPSSHEQLQAAARWECPANILLERTGGWFGQRQVELALYDDGEIVYFSEKHHMHRSVRLTLDEMGSLLRETLRYPGLVPKGSVLHYARFPRGAFHAYGSILEVRLPKAVRCLTAAVEAAYSNPTPKESAAATQADVVNFLKDFEHEGASEWVPTEITLEFVPVTGKYWSEYPWRDDWPQPKSGYCEVRGTCIVTVSSAMYPEMRRQLLSRRLGEAARIGNQLWSIGVNNRFRHDPEYSFYSRR